MVNLSPSLLVLFGVESFVSFSGSYSSLGVVICLTRNYEFLCLEKAVFELIKSVIRLRCEVL